MTESPAGSGSYRVSIAPLYPHYGDATVSIAITCPSGSSTDIEFTIYIDPSGTVVDPSGHPIRDATVTLLRSDTSGGPFAAVPDGSAVMSPSARSNPQVTAHDGIFHWDVIAGFYQVQATKPGCHAVDNSGPVAISRVYEIPPPAINLRLVLSCTQEDTTPPSITTNPLTLEGNTTGGYSGPLGGVTITDPDDLASVVTVSNNAPTLLPLGTTTVTYTARDPAGNSATADQVVTVVDTTPPAITCPGPVIGTYTPSPTLGVPGVSDIVDADASTSNNAPSSFPAGQTTVTWTATDHSGNHATCEQLVRLQATTAVLYNGTQILNVGSALRPAASLASAAPTCVSGQSISFVLDRNPSTGATGQYVLSAASTNSSGQAASSPVNTAGWREGVYEITASYAGVTNACGPSSDTATLTVAGAGDAASGGGWYTLSGSGRSNFGLTVKKKSDGSYSGQFTLVNNGKWRLKGTLENYSKTGSSGAVEGKGTLYFWDRTLNGGLGGWAIAGSSVSFTASFADNGSGGGKTKTPDTFGVHINYVPQTPQPSTLPNNAPVAIKGGDLRVS
jgi:hypothetical protein